MRGLVRRAEALARAEQQRRIAQISGRLKDRLQGYSVSTDGDSVEVRGRGLLRRWLVDPGLRFIGAER